MKLWDPGTLHLRSYHCQKNVSGKRENDDLMTLARNLNLSTYHRKEKVNENLTPVD